ncbi:MAG: PKD domain-containing protein, partial [Bacteroidales bacterium]|nr:PKD domain-containing protein [Bacteroidales bacterium]
MKQVIFILFAFLSIVSFGQKDNTELINAQKQIARYGDVYFKFTVSQKADLQNLPQFISIDNFKDNTVFAYVHEKNFKKLLDLQISFQVVPKTSGTKTLTMATTTAQMANWDRYPTYSVYVQMVQDMAANHPSICRLDTIGLSQEGRLILVLKITDNPDIDEYEPEFLYTAQMHGDEIVDYIMFLRLADYILNNYGTDPEVSNLVNNVEIWINPLSNPDGTYHGGNNDVSGAQRELSSGIDPNRNYPYPLGDHADGNSWQQETLEMMAFADAHDFVMSANTHSGAELVNYPWDTWTSAENPPADDNWWQFVSQEFADTIFAHSSGGYFASPYSSGYTEGADWYYAYGSRQDYMNFYQNCREVTVELSNVKLLDVAELPAHWNYTYRSFLKYIEESTYGIRGIITDACTGQPVQAKVEIIGHDADNSFVYSGLPLGDYYRPIYSGTYNVTYSAQGYQSVTINNISISNHDTTIQNVQLSPVTPTANFVAEATSSCTGEINFIDSSITSVSSSYSWTFGDGNTDTVQNPTHFYTTNGTYSVTLSLDNGCGGTDSYTQTNYITINMPAAPNGNDDAICGPGSVTLNASGTGTLVWYDSPTGGTELGSGAIFTTPTISLTTTYYVENIIEFAPQYVGNTSSSSNGGNYTFNNEHYLIFDCLSPLILNSVEVNAGSNGNREIILRKSSGVILYDTTIYITSGISRIDLNFNLPVANNLELVGPVSPGLYRNNSGVSYPYSIGGLISINNSDAGNGYYYYYYDWEVQEPSCISTRTPITLTINLSPITDFSYSVSGLDVDFTNNSSGGTTYSWDFGDGNTDTQVSPTHHYTTPGTYTVTLITTGSNGCSDTLIQSVDVLVGINNIPFSDLISVSPNPL